MSTFADMSEWLGLNEMAHPDKKSCCWKGLIFSSRACLAMTMSLHLDLKEIKLFWLSVSRSSHFPLLTWSCTVCLLPDHWGQPLNGCEACCLPAGLGTLLLAKDLKKRLGGVYSRCQAECEPKCTLPASKVSHTISNLWRTWPDGGKLLSFSTSVTAQLESYIHFCALQLNRDTGKLERVCRRGKKLVKGPMKRGWGIWAFFD